MIFDYDEESDVMYVVLEKSAAPCSYAENANGDILRIERGSNRVVGVTIPFFSSRSRESKSLEIPGIGPIPLDAVAMGLQPAH